VGISTRQLPPLMTCLTIFSWAPRKAGRPKMVFRMESAVGAMMLVSRLRAEAMAGIGSWRSAFW